jgi:hypothetical protein
LWQKGSTLTPLGRTFALNGAARTVVRLGFSKRASPYGYPSPSIAAVRGQGSALSCFKGHSKPGITLPEAGADRPRWLSSCSQTNMDLAHCRALYPNNCPEKVHRPNRLPGGWGDVLFPSGTV